MNLEVEAACHAIQTQCADPLERDVVKTAYAIVEIANAAMVNALRLVSVQRGYDPRDFVLVADRSMPIVWLQKPKCQPRLFR